MKASKNITVIFLMLFLGFQLQVNAQGAGGVSSFTIEVTEDMLAHVDGGNYDFDVDFENYENGQYNKDDSNVSVSMLVSQGSCNGSSHAGSEVQINPADSSSILAMLNNQLAQAGTIKSEDGMYRVVLEYN